MLPIFRTISVGGVLLAITILVLALSPPGGSHVRFSSAGAPASGALLAQGDHPEWRQFLILAALRRADELSKLRDLPDTAVRLAAIPDVAPDYVPAELLPEMSRAPSEDATRIAGLPAARSDADDDTGSINTAPGATIPIEIGEPSSTELPVNPVDDRPPVIRAPLTETPEPVEAPAARISATETLTPLKATAENRNKNVQHRRAKTPLPPRTQAPAPAQAEAPPPFNLLQAFFESLLNKPPAKAAAKPAPGHRARVKAKRTAAIRADAQ